MVGSGDSSIPWRRRLAAWWRGYDAAEYAAWQAGNEPSSRPSMESLIPPMPDLSSVDHARARINVLQRLFGPGFTMPGGADHAIAMVKPFGLLPVHSVLDLSAGLGGCATAIVQRFGVWITGYEMDPELAELAPEVVSSLKGGDHVTVRGFSPDDFTLRPKSFDCVVSRESLFGVRDRGALLKEIHSVLKDWGQLVITDYVLPSDQPPSDRVQNWMESEDLTYKPWSKADYERAFTGLGFDVRVLEDRSDEHRAQIRVHFARFVENLDPDSPVASDPAHRAALMTEAERWSRRAALLESGDLALYRFFVLKPEAKTG